MVHDKSVITNTNTTRQRLETNPLIQMNPFAQPDSIGVSNPYPGFYRRNAIELHDKQISQATQPYTHYGRHPATKTQD
jgi:hypothetical protein